MSIYGRCLVLNQAWIPISTITIRGAMILLYRNRAHAMNADDYTLHDIDSWIQNMDPGENPIQASSAFIRRPEVIVLRKYDKIPRKGVSFTRHNLYRRDTNTCQYCQRLLRKDERTIDHVLPKSRGGRNSWINCVLACQKCNARKGSRTPGESGMKLRSEPRQPSWNPYYESETVKPPESWKIFCRDISPLEQNELID